MAFDNETLAIAAMKKTAWLIAIAQVPVAMLCFVLLHMVLTSCGDLHRAVPAFTRFIAQYQALPPIVACGLSVPGVVLFRRNDVKPEQILLYAGIVLATWSLLGCAWLLAALLPIIPVKA